MHRNTPGFFKFCEHLLIAFIFFMVQFSYTSVGYAAAPPPEPTPTATYTEFCQNGDVVCDVITEPDGTSSYQFADSQDQEENEIAHIVTLVTLLILTLFMVFSPIFCPGLFQSLFHSFDHWDIIPIYLAGVLLITSEVALAFEYQEKVVNLKKGFDDDIIEDGKYSATDKDGNAYDREFHETSLTSILDAKEATISLKETLEKRIITLGSSITLLGIAFLATGFALITMLMDPSKNVYGQMPRVDLVCIADLKKKNPQPETMLARLIHFLEISDVFAADTKSENANTLLSTVLGGAGGAGALGMAAVLNLKETIGKIASPTWQLHAFRLVVEVLAIALASTVLDSTRKTISKLEEREKTYDGVIQLIEKMIDDAPVDKTKTTSPPTIKSPKRNRTLLSDTFLADLLPEPPEVVPCANNPQNDCLVFTNTKTVVDLSSIGNNFLSKQISENFKSIENLKRDGFSMKNLNKFKKSLFRNAAGNAKLGRDTLNMINYRRMKEGLGPLDLKGETDKLFKTLKASVKQARAFNGGDSAGGEPGTSSPQASANDSQSKKGQGGALPPPSPAKVSNSIMKKSAPKNMGGFFLDYDDRNDNHNQLNENQGGDGEPADMAAALEGLEVDQKDIHDNLGPSLFEIITTRYKKSGLRHMLLKREN